MKKLTVGFSADEKKALGSVLQSALVRLLELGLVTKQAHWNVVGPNFRPFHLHLDEIFAETQANIDTVAERMTALAINPNGQVGDLTGKEVAQLEKGNLRDSELLVSYSERLHQVITDLRTGMDEIEDVDTVTADILHQVVAGYEKHLWMLRVQIS